MGIKQQLIVLALGASLILTGCQQQAATDGGGGTTGGGTTGAAATTTTGGDSTPDANATAAPDATGTPSASAAGPEIAHDLKPLSGKENQAPKITSKKTIKFVTTAGDLVIEVYPDAAPNAAARFVELTESGFFNDTPISRVVTGFVAQFGVNWRDPHKAYKEKNFNDDPTYYQLSRGTLAFAKAGPNTNSTQVFINFGENNRLASPQYNFTTFGKVVEGMEVVDSFAVVGDPQMGLDQQRLWADGSAYIESLDKKPTMIEKAMVVE